MCPDLRRYDRFGWDCRREDLPSGGPVLRVEGCFPLLREAGSEPRPYVGYEEREDDGRDRTLCFVCPRK